MPELKPVLKKTISSPSWKAKLSGFSDKFSAFSRLFKSKHYASADDLFFAIEDLPSMGKEYWFLYFCAPHTDSQVILTLGRSSEPVKVNETELPDENPAQGSVNCAAVCWMHSGRKRVLFDSTAQVRVESGRGKKSILASNGKNRMRVNGKYPHYDVLLESNGKELFKAHIFLSKKDMPYEMIHLLKNPVVPRFGAAMINYYFDFKGHLLGTAIASKRDCAHSRSGANLEPLSGKAYLQKVVAVLPLAPWNWARLQFESGAALDFFKPKPLGEGIDMQFACNDHFEFNGKRIPLRGLKLQQFLDGEKTRFMLTSKDLFISMETYSLQPFVMRQKTVFRYDEYLVKVTDFAFRSEGRLFTLADVGQGRGIVEDASGYLL